MKKLTAPENPIFNQLRRQRWSPTFDCKDLKTPWVHRAKVPTGREIRKFQRIENAAEALGEIYPGCSIFGITKGQFSLISLITAILDKTGPAHLFVSTWTASGSDLTDAFKLLSSGQLLSCRFLVDHTFQRRKPAFAAKIRELFGIEAVRVTRNHAKFSLIRNASWDLVLKTSMNLNFNPRLEDFDLQDDPALAVYLQDFVDEIFCRRKKTDISDAPSKNEKRFLKL